MKYILIALIMCVFQVAYAQNYNQSVKDFAEGKYYTNTETGSSIKYGYISSLNTYGVTYKDAEGNLAYFMNCSEQLSSDEQYMTLTYCMSSNTGGTLNKIVVTKNEIILTGIDGNLTFYLENQSVQNQSGQNISIPKPKVYKIDNLEVSDYSINCIGMTSKEVKLECAKLGKGWRLPTKKELQIMCENKKLIMMETFRSVIGLDNNNFISISEIDCTLEKISEFGSWHRITPVRTIITKPINTSSETNKTTKKKASQIPKPNTKSSKK